MASLRRLATLAAALVVFAAVAVFDPDPQSAQANIACGVGVSPAAPITGAIGIGNPLGDACEAITDPVLGALPDPLDPVKNAVDALGAGIFEQITSWATDGAVWLLGAVAELTERTTSPNLLSKGFLRQYGQMAQIAALLAALMLIFAVIDALGRGDPGMLWRAFLVNAPLAAIATSVAYVVVRLLLSLTDGLCEAVTQATAADTARFFRGATEALAQSGGGMGAVAASGTGSGVARGAGAVSVPLFVSFIAAILIAFAAFFIWIELLMRDAAIYVVALFMPLALAASIWPRWTSSLHRSCELVIVIVFSKFVIVAIIALAASLLAHSKGDVEQVLAAGAMLLLACFAPLVLFRLVPFAEGAIGSAYHRRGTSGGAAQVIHTASSAQAMSRAARTHWSSQRHAGGRGSLRQLRHPIAGGGGASSGAKLGSGLTGSGGAAKDPASTSRAGGVAAAGTAPAAVVSQAAAGAGKVAVERAQAPAAVQASPRNAGTGKPENAAAGGVPREAQPARPDGRADQSTAGGALRRAGVEATEASGGGPPRTEGIPLRPPADVEASGKGSERKS